MTLGVVLTVWFLGKKLSDANASLLQAQHTQLSLADVLVSLTGAETGVRGYVLTGDTNYLEPWEETGRRLSSILDELDQQARTGDSRTPGDAHRIRQLAEERLARLGETLNGLPRVGARCGDRRNPHRSRPAGHGRGPPRHRASGSGTGGADRRPEPPQFARQRAIRTLSTIVRLRSSSSPSSSGPTAASPATSASGSASKRTWRRGRQRLEGIVGLGDGCHHQRR